MIESDGIPEVLDVGGKPYRLGFHHANWFGVEKNIPAEEIRRVFRRENVMSDAPLLSHYTSIGGLYGIIESGGFWASDNRFMNDSEERIHGVNFVLNAVRFYKKRRHTLPEFQSVLDKSMDLISGAEKYFYLVTCFSDAQDSLEQWRGYGKAGGVAIRLGTRSPNGHKYISAGPDLLLKTVLYADNAKARMILSILRRYEQEYRKDRALMTAWWPDDHDKNYSEALANRMIYASLVFKDKAFRAERETRHIIPAEHADRFGGLKFRTTAFGVVGYVNTGSGQTGNLPISEVIVGPSPHASVTLESLRTYLNHRGYRDVEFKLSKVPFRDY